MNEDELLEMMGCAPEDGRAASLPPLAVRVHRLTLSQALRVCGWARALPAVHVLADVTKYLEADRPPPETEAAAVAAGGMRSAVGAAAVLLLREQLQRHGLESRVTFSEFTSQEMECRYPHLRHEVLDRWQRKHLAWTNSHAYAYTAEGLVIDGLGVASATAPPQHCWVFEHDCDFSGDIGELLAAYADDAADLIAKELVPRERIATEWMWHDCCTPAFKDAYGAVRCCAHVHAFRISSRLLRALHVAATDGRIGYGEMSVPTICVGEGLEWRRLREEHIGDPFSPEHGMTKDAFECATTEGHTGQHRLYHALKW